MKIVLAVPRFAHGGPAKVYRELSRWLHAHGHTVHVAMDARTGEPVEAGEGIVVHRLRARGPQLLGKYPVFPMWQLLRAERPHIVMGSLHMVRTIALIRPFLPRGIVTVARPANFPRAEAAHSNRRRLRRRIHFRLEARVERRLHAVVAQTPIIAADVRARGFRGPMEVIGNPAAPPSSTGEAISPLVGDPKILYVGRLARPKGVDLLLAAHAEVLAHLPHAHLHLVGEGRARARLTALAEELGISHAVTFHGHSTNVRAYMETADLMVSPSRFEGFTNTIPEAQCLGLPVVATDCPGAAADVLDSTHGGVVVESENPTAIAHGIRDVVSRLHTFDPADIVARAEATWGIDVIGARYEAFFRQLTRG